MCIYIYIYILYNAYMCSSCGRRGWAGRARVPWVALLVCRYLSNTASSALCVFCRVKDHRKLLHYSLHVKKTCVRQVALDEWFPPSAAGTCCGPTRAASIAFVLRACVCVCVYTCIYIYIYIYIYSVYVHIYIYIYIYIYSLCSI